jgi:hypothetical protein
MVTSYSLDERRHHLRLHRYGRFPLVARIDLLHIA